MNLIDTAGRAAKRELEANPPEQDIPPGAMASLRAHIAAEVRKAGANGIELRAIMNARRNDKSGPRFWQCFTDAMWLQVAQDLEAEWSSADAEALKPKGK